MSAPVAILVAIAVVWLCGGLVVAFTARSRRDGWEAILLVSTILAICLPVGGINGAAKDGREVYTLGGVLA